MLSNGNNCWPYDKSKQDWNGGWIRHRRSESTIPCIYERSAIYKPEIQFKVTFIGSWYDPPKAKEAAFAQIEAGVDIMYAERAGVVDACREKGILAFGNVNDMNKEENGENVVVTSALWHMENAINHAIGLVKNGNFKAEEYHSWTMMAGGGASLAPYYEFENKISGDVKDQVAKLADDILAGKFVVEINDEEPTSTF